MLRDALPVPLGISVSDMTNQLLLFSFHRHPSIRDGSAATMAWILLASFLLAPTAARAQFDSQGNESESPATIGSGINPLQQQLTRFPGAGEMIPLEGTVDADQYIVGPGDLFGISVGGPQPLIAPVAVSADGYLILPEAGAVQVGGSSLQEARSRAKQALRESFKNVRVEIALSQPRQFYVHVSGAVPFPGRYLATPVGRLAGVLRWAYADSTQSTTGNLTFRPALRNVLLAHTDGTQETVDLLRYHATGNTEHNPYLRDGDIVSVRAFDPNYGAVFISGNVAFPGIYDHRPDDTLSDLLALATGQEMPDYARQVRLTRVLHDGSVEAEIYDVAALYGGEDVQVLARDQVHVLAEKTIRGVADIDGWVQYPGTYPILSGETTLQDLVALAGGIRPGALARAAHLQRPTLPSPEPAPNRFGTLAGIPDPGPANLLGLIRSAQPADMDFFGSAYLARNLRIHYTVPVDLIVALAEGLPPILLQNGDRIYVPRDNNQVFVFGKVNRPGYVTYRGGMPSAYYINAANGLGTNAGTSYVIKAGTNRFVKASEAEIESEDRIFVNRETILADTEDLQRLLTEDQRLKLEDQRLKLERQSRNVQTIVASIGAASSIIFAYLLSRQK